MPCPLRAVPVAAYQWLVCFLLEKSQRRLEEQRAAGLDDFDARNNSQVEAAEGGARRGNTVKTS